MTTPGGTVERYEDVEFGDELPELRPDVSMPTVRRFGHATGMTSGASPTTRRRAPRDCPARSCPAS